VRERERESQRGKRRTGCYRRHREAQHLKKKEAAFELKTSRFVLYDHRSPQQCNARGGVGDGRGVQGALLFVRLPFQHPVVTGTYLNTKISAIFGQK